MSSDGKEFIEFLTDMRREQGASERELLELEKAMQVSLPAAYRTMLLFSNGAAGKIGPEYIHLYSIQEVLQVNSILSRHAEGLFIFGSDGGGEAYVFDPANDWSVGVAPFIP